MFIECVRASCPPRQKDLDKRFQLTSQRIPPCHPCPIPPYTRSPNTVDTKYNPLPLTDIVSSFFQFPVLVWPQFTNPGNHQD